MKRFLNALVIAGWLQASLSAGPSTIPLYVNQGTSPAIPPQIDAIAFLNLGTFFVTSDIEYDFQNTRYYTNRGTMIGGPGFRFDFTDDNGVRRPAARFVNESIGRIGSIESALFPGYSNYYSQAMMRISATNIVNAGIISIGNSGTVQLRGETLDLRRGGIEVQPVVGLFAANDIQDVTDDGIPDIFFPENAIYDTYWGAGIQEPPQNGQPPPLGPINTSTILRYFGQDILATTPRHWVSNLNASGGVYFQTAALEAYPTTAANTGIVASTFLVLTNADGSTTNISLPTNIFRQAVITGISDTNFFVRTKFGAPSFAGLGLGTVAVQIGSLATNGVAGTMETNSIYFVDYLGATTNTLALTNQGFYLPTMRPFAYRVSRNEPSEYSFGANGNSPVFKSILYDAQLFSNIFATNYYAGYRCEVDFLTARPPQVPGATVTNTPGRIEIIGDNVDLTRARLRGMSTIKIDAKHLKGSEGASVDVENLIYNMASTNGLLTIRNLGKESVNAVSGSLLAWSGVWSNQFALVLSNWFIDATTNYFNPVTNEVDVNIYCLILSADFMGRTQQVVTHTLSLSSDAVVNDDPFQVSTALKIDAISFTQNGQFGLTGDPLESWTFDMTPRLLYMTNNGRITVPNVASFGADFPSGRLMKVFNNRGTLEAAAHDIAADLYLDEAGTILTQNDLRIFANSAILQGGFNNCTRGAVRYAGNNFKMRAQHISAAGGFYINATNSFTDSGSDANNLIEVQNGFSLLRKPASGDLLGTRFNTTAPRFASVSHLWAAEDRGATAAGFKDNEAIGWLQLNSLPGGELRFGPPTDDQGQPLPGNFAMYVDYLEFATNSVALDPEAYMVIEPGLTIYYGAANLPNDQINGMFDGRLRWVRNFVGPNSGVDVALWYGVTIRVNVGLLESTTIDSDGDGIVNAYDVTPFDNTLITDLKVLKTDPFTTRLSWRAAANTVYSVQYATSLEKPDWTVFATATNAEPTIQTLTVTDVVPTSGTTPGGRQRYYRVRYEP